MSAVQQQSDLGVATDEQAPGFARAIDAPLLAELYAYWTAKRGARFAPSRAEIDPVEIPRLLPHLMLVDIKAPLKAGERVPLVLRFQHAGEMKVELEVRPLGAAHGMPGMHGH